MPRSHVVLTVAAVFLLTACGPDALTPTEARRIGIDPIVNGVPDGTGHPNVGALLTFDFNDDGQFGVDDLLCSGTYVGPDQTGSWGVFLTAAHCLFAPGTEDLYLTLQSAPDGSGYYSPAQVIAVDHAVAHPGFTWKQNDPGDLALLFFPIASVP